MIDKISLKAARINRDLTAQQLGERLGVSQQIVTHWENGVTYVPPEMFEKICVLLKYEPEDIRLPKE